MTLTLDNRTFADAIFWEPLELIKAQPPQIFISAASAFLIAAEANVLLPTPFHILLAVGAEWGYLRGMASGAALRTKWTDRLTWANGALVVLYGALFSLRKFGALESVEAYHAGTVQTSIAGAVVMTLIHIACIGAVTICAMMTHAAMLAHAADEATRDRTAAQRRQEEAHARDRMLQEERDRIALDMERKRQELSLWEEGQRAKMQMHDARKNMRRNALPARANADEKKCPKCGAELAQSQWLAARRWGHCSNCKGVE